MEVELRFFGSEDGSRRVISFVSEWQGKKGLRKREVGEIVEVVPGFGYGFNSGECFLSESKSCIFCC